MISLNDVLLAMSNIPVDDPIAEIWGRQMQGGYKIIEYTGTFPITINANGDALIDYHIYGADGGVGEPTENLFDLAKSEMNCYYDTSGTKRNSNSHNTSDYIPVESGKTYTLSLTRVATGFEMFLNLWDDGKQFVTNLMYKVNPEGSYSFSSPINGYIRFNWLPNYTHNVMLTKGSTAPTSYIPYGYKLPMTVQSANLLDSENSVNGRYLLSDGSEGTQSNFAYTDFLKIDASIPYTITNYDGSLGGTAAICFYDANFDFLYGITYYSRKSITFTPETNVAYVRCSYKTTDRVSLSLGSTAPTEYIPCSKQSIPVYIGENKLDAGEYVSYSEQKIYRNVSGTLTPTEPPVSLPKIPTIDGETVIDYDGTPKPSQMYVKYKDKG